MNIEDAASAEPAALPELSDERVDEIETALFAGIARERLIAQGDQRRLAARRARRRRTAWWTAAAAAVVVVGAVAAGPVLGGLGSGTAGSVAVDENTGGAETGVPQPGQATDSGAGTGLVGGKNGLPGGTGSSSGSSVTPREMIATAQATVRVADTATAARAIAAAAEKRGGYVESMNIGQTGDAVVPRNGAVDGVSGDASLPYPATGTWITVRVPADQLTGAIDELSQIGTVEGSSITRQDVTEQAVDLRARIDALETSVKRLTALMGKAGSVGDLINAETALSRRQAELESLQQQLTSLEGQVSLSSLTVSLTSRAAPVKADPAGFGDGLATGWNGLVATLNGLVVALGFLLPWLAVAAILFVIVWLVLRSRRRRAADDAEVGPR